MENDMANPVIPGGYYIKARAIQKSSIMRQPPHVREIWDYLLMNANHSDHKYGGYSIKRGQLFRTYKQIREDLSWNVGWRKETYNENQMKKAMKFLRESLMIATTKEPGGVMITVLNYNYYQDPANYERTSEGTDERTNDEPMTNQPVPYNKKKNNVRMEEDIKVQKSEEPNDRSDMDDSNNIISQSDPHRDISPSDENPAEDNRSPGIRVDPGERTDSKTGNQVNGGDDGNTGLDQSCIHGVGDNMSNSNGQDSEKDDDFRSYHRGDDGQGVRREHRELREIQQRHAREEDEEIRSQVISKTETTGGVDEQITTRRQNQDDAGRGSTGDPRSMERAPRDRAETEGGSIIQDSQAGGGQQTLPGISGTSGTAGEDMRDSAGIDNSAHPDFGEGVGLRSCNKQENCREGVDKRYSERSSKKRNGKSLDLSEEPKYKTSRKKWLKGQRLSDFEIFWNEFGDKRGKPGAAQSWLDLDDYSPDLVKAIIHGAKEYALERFDILERKGTPKMAQGWLTDRRWEDYPMEDQSKQQGRKIDVKKEMAELRARAKQLEIRDANEKRKNGTRIQTPPVDIVKPDSGATIESGSNQATGSALRQLFG